MTTISDITATFLQQTAKPLIVVVGPTASGKTDFSVNLALALGGGGLGVGRGKWKNVEIINADSRQLYKYLDIGTAKIRAEEAKGILHHLIDVLDPKEEVTASWFKDQAQKLIKEIHNRGNIPMLVGGSMLYISAVIDDLTFPSASDPKVRKLLSEKYDQDDGVSLFKELQKIDPETASAFHRNNKPYVLRAMEIAFVEKKPPSKMKHAGKSPYDLLMFGMEWERAELHERINKRTKQLFEMGWIDEVKKLLEKGFTAKDPAMKSHGYREIAEAISNGKLEMPARPMPGSNGKNEKYMKELIESISAQGRQYAKRQMTWWRHDPRIQWVHP